MSVPAPTSQMLILFRPRSPGSEWVGVAGTGVAVDDCRLAPEQAGSGVVFALDVARYLFVIFIN